MFTVPLRYVLRNIATLTGCVPIQDSLASLDHLHLRGAVLGYLPAAARPCPGCSRERQARHKEPVTKSTRAMSRTAVAAQRPSVRQLSARRVLSRSRCRPRSPGMTQGARDVNVFTGPRCGLDSCRSLYRLHAQLLLPQNRVRGLATLTEPTCGVAPAPAWPAA